MAPILFPLAVNLEVNAIHFGILMAINVQVGPLPSSGGAQSLRRGWPRQIGITEMTVAVLPWLGALLTFLVIATYVPGISLSLPRLLGVLR